MTHFVAVRLRPACLSAYASLIRSLRERKADYRSVGLNFDRVGFAPTGCLTEFHEVIAYLSPFGPAEPGRFRPSRPGGDKNAIRLDFSKLPAPLQYLASNTLLTQILREHQLGGPRPLATYLLVDESSLCAPPGKASVLARIAAEGRKFGLGLVVSTQQAGLLPKPLVFNAFTKIVMRLDKTEIRAAARSLEIDDLLLCSLKDPGAALVNFSDSHQWHRIQVGRVDA